MFNPDLLIQLIKSAQGNRSLNQFAQLCGIDSGNLSRILNNKNKQPPKPATLKKIADNAFEAVTYEQLMAAAGHMAADETEAQDTAPKPASKDERHIEMKIEALKNELLNNQEKLTLAGEPVSPEAIESIIEALSFSIKQAKIVNKNYNPKKHRR
jgi:HTH-type transcriptional regulator, competence development regulator